MLVAPGVPPYVIDSYVDNYKRKGDNHSVFVFSGSRKIDFSCPVFACDFHAFPYESMRVSHSVSQQQLRSFYFAVAYERQTVSVLDDVEANS